jgi:formylmethanofuran dehydrogenase subunit A
VLKDGEIVVEEGEVIGGSEGREFIVRPQFDAGIEAYIRPLFQQIYTISFDNYPVALERLRHPEQVTLPSKPA